MNKKQIMSIAVLLVILVMAIIPKVTAQSPLDPTKDIWCQAFVGGGCLNGSGLSTISQQASCTTQRVAFLGWDLSTVTETIGSAELVLTSYFVSAAPVPPNELTFELFIPSTQDWTEATTSSPGSSGAALATAQLPLLDGSTPQSVTFGGSSNPSDAVALGTYLNDLKASGSATVGVRITGGCLENTVVAFNDREQSGGMAAAKPALFLFTPTAVQFVSSSASGDTQTPLAPVLLVVALLGLTALTATLYYKPLLSRRD